MKERDLIPVSVTGREWMKAPIIKSRLGSGYCLRARAQGACEYANTCEHCSSFRVDQGSVGVLRVQRADTVVLKAGGWGLTLGAGAGAGTMRAFVIGCCWSGWMRCLAGGGLGDPGFFLAG